MVPFRKGIAILSLAMVAPALTSLAQSPGVLMEDYTSDITTTELNGNSFNQQVGAPLGTPVLVSGDDVLLQGLFAALTGVKSTQESGSNDITLGDVAEIEILYNGALKSLTVAVPDEYLKSRLMLVNVKGETVKSVVLEENRTTVDLSSIAPDIYIAGVASQNSIFKTLKFNLK